MKQVEIIRILDDTSFVVNAGSDRYLEPGYFIDVLKRDKSYKYIAKIEEYTLNYLYVKDTEKKDSSMEML